jgi:hypothetical protein
VRLHVEEVDLDALTAALLERFAVAAPAGYLVGRTAIRDSVSGTLGCSDLEAEEIVDTMISRGFVRYDGDPTTSEPEVRPWLFRRR